QVQVRHPTVLDDEGRHVARVYAEALYRAAERAGQQAEVLADLDAVVNGVFRADPGLELFFASAALGRERKRAALEHAFEGRANPLFVHSLLVLNERDRLGTVRAVAAAYRALHERRSNRLPVQVRSAVALTDEERGRVWHDVRDVTGREPVLEERVDPDLLG